MAASSHRDGSSNTASPQDTLAELEAVSAELLALASSPVTDAELVHRAERAVAFAIAWLAPSRAEAAVAVEAAIAGADPRDPLPRADDLAITIELATNGLRHALDQPATT